MRIKKAFLTTLLLTFAIILSAQNQTTFILVRHAEKAHDGTGDPPLNDDGKIRSAKLAELLGNQEITVLYSTPFKRTTATLQPIAERKNLEIINYDPYVEKEWLTILIEKHAGGTIVISGHSNTIPALTNALLGTEVLSQFDESDYSNLIIIVTDEVGKGQLIRLKF